MNVDRVARAMTGGGPRADFAARVMAPIYGRPRPGFTARVTSAAQDFSPAGAPPVAQAFRPAFRIALVLVPAALALAAAVMVARASRVDLPAAPAGPKLATASLEVRLAVPLEAAVATTPARIARRAEVSAPAEEPAIAPPAPIYVVPALEAPTDIAMKSIEPGAVAITPLAAPAPLTIPSLEGSKEKS